MKRITRKTKHLFLAVAATIMCGCVASTGLFSAKGNSQMSASAAMDTEDEFMLGSWVSYFSMQEGAITDYAEQTEDLAKSGLNYIPHPYWSSWNSTRGGAQLFDVSSLDGWKEVNQLYSLYNMKFAMLTSSDTANRVAMGKQLENCNSYYVVDEPQYSAFDTWATVVKDVYALDDTRFSFCNLLPSYAGTSALGGSYDFHLQSWLDAAGKDIVEYLGIDHYPLLSTGYSSSYFSDMEIQRRIAFDNGRLKTGGFSQTGSMGDRRFPTADEAKWNVNTMLAYGYKMINHFNWIAPYDNSANGGEDFNDFVYKQDGTPSALYEPMQKINWQTRQLGNVMMGMDCMHAYHVGPSNPSGVETLPADFMVQPTATTQTNNQLILSQFVSKDDLDTYVAITNNDYDSAATCSFTLNEGITGLTRYDVDSFDTLPDPTQANAVGAPTEVAVDVSSHTFSATLQPGEIKLYKVEGSIVSVPIVEPTPSLESGTYSEAQTLTFAETDANTQIYYTTDGSYPTKSANLYTGTGIAIGETGKSGRVTVRYKAYKGKQETEVKSLNFFILPDGTSTQILSNEGQGWTWLDNTPNDDTDDLNHGWSWGVTNGSVGKTAVGGDWDTGIGWTVGDKYTDFVLEGDFKITANNGAGSGWLGFGINRSLHREVQSQASDGLFVGLMANGTDNMRTFFWHKQNESYGPSSVNTGVNYTENPTVHLCLVKRGDTVEFNVDGLQYTATNAAFDKSGYIAIFASQFAVSVSNLKITTIEAAKYESVAPAVDYFLDDTSVVNPTKIAVDKGVAFDNLGLPATTTVKDTAGNSYTLDVVWSEGSYNMDTSGVYALKGELVMPVQLANVSGIEMSVDVLVRYDFDRQPIYDTIAYAKTLKAENYTVSSFSAVEDKIAMAEELVNDEWQSEMMVVVGKTMLESAIDKLVDISGLKALIAEVDGLDLSGYTQGTDGIAPALATANATLAKADATAAEVAAATDELLAAQYALKTAVTESFTVAGMSIRTGAPEGLRFVATMSSAMKTQYASAKFGMMILPADLDTQKAWTVSYDGTTYTADNDALVIEMGEWWSSDLMSENALSGAAYSCALVGDTAQFPEDFYNRPMTAVAFVIGDDEVVYSAKVTRSIAYVAKVESMKADYTQSETVDRLSAGAEVSLTVGGDNQIKYGASASPVLKIGGMDATTSSLVSVAYQSGNTAIAMIESGSVKAVGNGTVTITATVSVAGGSSFTKSVEVTCYGDLSTYTPYYEAGFEGWSSAGDAWTAPGSDVTITTTASEVVSGDYSMKVVTNTAGVSAGWNQVLSSNLGGIANGQRYLVQMKMKVTLPADKTGGQIYFRLQGVTADYDALVLNVNGDGTWSIAKQADSETMVSYDAATGVFTVGVFMTSDADGRTFYLTTVGGGAYTLILDDISFAKA